MKECRECWYIQWTPSSNPFQNVKFTYGKLGKVSFCKETDSVKNGDTSGDNLNALHSKMNPPGY
jgi:hypothetical protein